jgi:hypothetical protein
MWLMIMQKMNKNNLTNKISSLKRKNLIITKIINLRKLIINLTKRIIKNITKVILIIIIILTKIIIIRSRIIMVIIIKIIMSNKISKNTLKKRITNLENWTRKLRDFKLRKTSNKYLLRGKTLIKI